MSEGAKKLLYIVKESPTSSDGFATFLKNRDWKVESTTELKMALVSILSKPIHCILISVDHPSPKCLRLPDIIRQTVKIPVILYSDSSNNAGLRHLRNSTHPYILFPPVSGPAVERLLARIEKDRTLAEEIKKNNPAKGRGGLTVEDSGDPTVRTQGGFNIDEIVRIFDGADQGSMKRADSGSNAAIAGAVIGDGKSTEGMSSHQHNASVALRSLASEKNQTPGRSQLVAVPVKAERKRAAARNADGERESESDMEVVKARELQIAEAALLIRGTEHAMEIARVSSTDLQDRERPVSLCSRVNCFEIQTDVFSGFVVVAYGAEAENEKNFNETMRANLEIYLKDNGMTVKVDDSIDVKLTQINFEGWSIEEASFLRKSIHDEKEIAIAFFPSKEKLSPLEISDHVELYKFSLNEIRPHIPVEFDFYVHLSVNQKYVRYAKKDGVLQESQINRLKAGGVKDIHIPVNLQKDITRYRVQNFLNDTIESYKKKTRDEPSSPD